MNLQQGTLLQGGKYKILRYINSGGFGCTYEAVHLMLDKKVAIKEFFVKDFCNRDENSVNITVGTTSKVGLVSKLKKKFIDEAVALCKLHHSNIVSVTDVFEENGTAYYVMDYIEGSSLNELIKTRGKLDEQTSLRYIRQVSEALGYVHSQNRLHLDIKPGNIMIDKKDNAILIDFGASKQYDEANGENTSTLMGKTPGYAPLEQMGNEVTQFYPATDIYSLGATLYKALTGITPQSANFLASGEELEPLPDNISENTKKAIYESMNINKKKRPQNIEEFLKLLDGEGVKTQDDDEATEIVGVERPKPTEPKKEEPRQDLPNEQKPKKKKSKAWIFILLAIIIGGAGYYFVNDKMKGEKKESEMLAQAEQERIKKEQEAAQIAQAQKEAEAKQKAEAEKKKKEEEARQKAEQVRLEKEKQELEAEKAELEAQKAEQARLEAERAEQARIEAERKRKEEETKRKAEQERLEKERQLYSQVDEFYCDGVYDRKESRYKNGHGLHTPDLNINKDHFRVSFSFKAVKNDTERYRWIGEQWVLVLSDWNRVLGVCLKNDGKVYVTTNNNDNYYETDLNYSINEYVDIDMVYEDGILYMNGQQIDIDMETPHDGQFHSVNYSNGIAFKGYIKDLRIYSYPD